MNRKSFLKKVFTGLIATKLAFELGAKTVSDSWKYIPTSEELVEMSAKDAERYGSHIADAVRKASPWSSLARDNGASGYYV